MRSGYDPNAHIGTYACDFGSVSALVYVPANEFTSNNTEQKYADRIDERTDSGVDSDGDDSACRPDSPPCTST